jgi:hypothetical protein
VIQVCTACPAPDGLEMTQTTIRIMMIQPIIFPIKRLPSLARTKGFLAQITSS